MVSLTDKGKPAGAGEPAWEIARLFPEQGGWGESDYLWVTQETNNFVEFKDGYVEVLAMPTVKHQRIVAFLYRLILAFVSERGLGEALFGPLRVQLRPNLIREPDILFMRRENAGRMTDDVWEGADLVVEVVSEDAKSRKRDLQEKRREYAEAGIPEYWIVDPQEGRVTVLTLVGKEYAVLAEGAAGQRVTSKLLAGFEVGVDEVLGAGNR